MSPPFRSLFQRQTTDSGRLAIPFSLESYDLRTTHYLDILLRMGVIGFGKNATAELTIEKTEHGAEGRIEQI